MFFLKNELKILKNPHIFILRVREKQQTHFFVFIVDDIFSDDDVFGVD